MYPEKKKRKKTETEPSRTNAVTQYNSSSKLTVSNEGTNPASSPSGQSVLAGVK